MLNNRPCNKTRTGLLSGQITEFPDYKWQCRFRSFVHYVAAFYKKNNSKSLNSDYILILFYFF